MNNRLPQSSSHQQVIEKILDKLAEAEQPLPHSLEFYRLILTAQNKLKSPDLSTILITLQKKANLRLAEGKPALTFANLVIDWADVQKLFREVTILTNEYLSPEAEEADELKQIGEDIDLLKETSRIWFGTGTLSRKSVKQGSTIKPLTASVLQATLNPVLSFHASELLPLVKQDLWYRNYCPICGGAPDFSFLTKEAGTLCLLCSRCNAQWIFHRLVCPFCGNNDHKQLAYFTDDSKLYRLYVCEKCRRYIKCIDLRQAKSEILMPLERINTLDMDRQAHGSNYKAE